MAVTLSVQLTNEQQAIMVEIAEQVLGADSTGAEKLAWATEVASKGLRDEVAELALQSIRQETNEQANTAVRTFMDRVEAAWVPETPVE